MKTVTVGALALLFAVIMSTSASAVMVGAGLVAPDRSADFVQQIDTKDRYGHNQEQRRGQSYNHHWGWYGWPSQFGLSLPRYANRYYKDHVEYCLGRYRSYDPVNNTFVGDDGQRHSARTSKINET